MPCSWCPNEIPEEARRDSVFCSRRCRQAAFRLRCRRTTAARHAVPMRFGYADPPYPGCAWRFYRREEVDHRELVGGLLERFPEGWALSTSAKSLREVLPLCPERARVCAWVKPNGAHPQTNGLHNLWEPLIVVDGRQRAPGVADWLRAKPAFGGGTLPGRKPLAFCAWLFDCLGMEPGDELVDLFPGTGVIGRAWREASRVAGARRVAGGRRPYASSLQAPDASSAAGANASRAAANDTSSQVLSDASPSSSGDTSRDVARDASRRHRR